jgi:hypothetical protein
MKTKVHRNLHKACWSVRRKGDKTAHTSRIFLSNVEFRVSQAGRAKVLEKKVRSVHAYAIGTEIAPFEGQFWERVSYNPYRAGAFTTLRGEAIERADIVKFEIDGLCWVQR